ncbi:MAG: hypothetical protein K2K97_02045 [Muribaculaceae bacterium]|nr:hypothetical protein [Muribaculaceae bacterium]
MPNTKKAANILKILGLCIGGFILVASPIVIFFVTYKDPELKWYGSAGLAGSWASIEGIAFTLWQVMHIKSTAEATRIATEHTRSEIQNKLNIVQVTEHCATIETIQTALQDREIRLALHLCRELKTSLIELREIVADNKVSELGTHIQVMGVDINNMHKSLLNNIDKLGRKKIIEDLEALHNTLTGLQVSLKHSN